MDIGAISSLATPQTISALSDGMQAVADGIQVKPGPTNIPDSLVESFSGPSFNPAELASAAMTPAAQTAGMSAPLDYLKSSPSQPGGASLVPQQDLIQTLQDPGFNVGNSIAECGNNFISGNGLVGNLMGQGGPLAEALGGVQLASGTPGTQGGITLVQNDPGAERGIVTDLKPADPGSERGIVTDLKTNDPGSERGIVTDLKTNDPGSDRGIVTDLKTNDPGSERGIVTDLKSSDPGAAPGLPYGSSPPSFNNLVSSLQDLNPFTDQGQNTLLQLRDQLQTFHNMQSTLLDAMNLQQQMRGQL